MVYPHIKSVFLYFADMLVREERGKAKKRRGGKREKESGKSKKQKEQKMGNEYGHPMAVSTSQGGKFALLVYPLI